MPNRTYPGTDPETDVVALLAQMSTLDVERALKHRKAHIANAARFELERRNNEGHHR